MATGRTVVLVVMLACLGGVLLAQEEDLALSNWSAPPYWSPAVQQRVDGEPGGAMVADAQGMQAQAEALPSSPLPFVAIAPCRIVDTRVAVSDGFHQPNFGDDEARTFNLPTSPDCPGLPATIGAYSLNIQFRPISQLSYLTAYPTGTTTPGVSTLTAGPAAWVQNAAIVPAGTGGAIDVYCQYAGRVVIDINGYYGPQSVVTSLNALTGDVTLAEGSNIDITPSGNTLTITATGGPGGVLPSGISGQTLYHNGVSWAAASDLFNNGTNVGISGNFDLPGTTATTGQITMAGFRYLHSYGATTNTFAGFRAGNTTLTGGWNTGVGYQSLASTSAGINNTGVGNASLQSNAGGNDNTGVGSFNLFLNTSGNYNTAIGSGSMQNNTVGSWNTAAGWQSLLANTTATANTAVGTSALANQSYNNAGAAWYSNNTAVGYAALSSNQPTSTTNGVWNTAVGAGALQFNTTGFSNTAAGYLGLQTNTLGIANTATGVMSLQHNTTASRNTAVGATALYTQSFSNSNAVWNSDNTAVGFEALFLNQPTATNNGYSNTAVGTQALRGNTTGYNNTATGLVSLISNSSGSNNTALGYQGLYGNTTGSYNIGIGYCGGCLLTTGSNNIAIGHYGVAGDSAAIRIGSSPNQTKTFIAGIWGVAVGQDAIPVVIDSNGQLGTVISSIRFKQDVADMGDASNRLMDLRPVTFRYKAHPGGPMQYGLIAEEVEQTMPELVVKDATGQVETVAYHELPPMLLNELQKQQATIQRQQAEIDELYRQVQVLLAAREAAKPVEPVRN